MITPGEGRLLPETRGMMEEAPWLEDSPPPAQTLGWLGNSLAGSLEPELGWLAGTRHARVMENGGEAGRRILYPCASWEASVLNLVLD